MQVKIILIGYIILFTCGFIKDKSIISLLIDLIFIFALIDVFANGKLSHEVDNMIKLCVDNIIEMLICCGY